MKQSKVSPLQVHPLRTLPMGMTESSHLSQAYLTQPEVMDSVLAYAFGTQNESVLAMLTGGMGNTRFVTNREYTWDLHGQVDVAIAVSGDPITNSAQPGLGGQAILFKLPENRFLVSDNLVADDGTQVRVKSVKSNGIDYIYTVELTSGNPDEWLDPAMIKVGARWSKDYSTVEEFSSTGGGTDFQAPMKLTNQLTTLRKQYSVTRSAATDVMVIELYSPKGEVTKYWTKLAEWTALAQWYNEIDKSLIYTKYNKTPQGYAVLKGENGRPIYTGAGLRQQISPANKRYYNKLTFALLDEYLLDLSYNASRWGGDHKFVALTGKMGMREFHNAIAERQKDLGITVTDGGTFITGSGDSLELGGYFKTVHFLNGISMTIKEFPPYDDIVRNRQLHPISKKPIESYRMTFLNFGTNAKGKGNIRKVAKAKSENAMWYVCGSTTPMGDVANNINVMRSDGIDGYQVHMLAEVGIQVQDPTSCGELILRTNVPIYS